MECRINEVVVHYVEHGVGVPLVALHGAGVDHREIEAALEAIVPDTGYRRIYPDLPGMGLSTTGGLTCNDDVDVRISNDFPEVAHVQALVPGGTAHVGYVISWSRERWALLIGTASHPVTGGAKPGIAGDESHLKSKIPK